MPIGTAVSRTHLRAVREPELSRVVRLLRGQRLRGHHEHEYNAIRNAAALIDVSPLFKYSITGPDAARLVDRIITRDVTQDGGRPGYLHAVVRRARQGHRRWHRVAAGREHVSLDRRGSEPALVPAERPRARRAQSRTSRSRSRRWRCRARRRRGCCEPSADADIDRAEVFPGHERPHRGRARRDLANRLHRRSRLRDLDAGGARDAGVGRADGRRAVRSTSSPAGMLALDVARIEAGLLLIDVDFFSGRKAMIAVADATTPYELGPRPAGEPGARGDSSASRRWREEQRTGPARQIVGLEIDWNEVEALYDAAGLPPAVAADGVARRGARLSQRPPGGQGDVDDMVARAEEDDRARDDRRAALRRGYVVPDSR